MVEPLSQSEFNTWREMDVERWTRLEAHIVAQNARNIAIAERLTALEETKRMTATRLGLLSTMVSSIVSAIVTSLFGVFRHG